MGTLISLISTMAKIGVAGFGGGNALVPVMEREMVTGSKLLTQEEFDKEVIVANITPGALPVELASGIGRKIAGNRGMIAAATAMALPGTVLTLCLLALYSLLAEPMSRQVRFASVGIVALIVLLLCSYSLYTVAAKIGKPREFRVSLFLILAVFALTSGKELNAILGIDATPLFAISTLNVLAITFFIIFYTRGHLHSRKTVVAAVISLLYLLSVGKAGVISSLVVRRGLQLTMVVLGGHGLICSIGGEENKLRTFPIRTVLRESLCWFLYIFLLCLPALLLYPGVLVFLGKAIASVFLSFGGGDAYLVIAKGLFVGSDMITRNEFYGQIATIANAMPGSILCKILSGVGFCLGRQQGTLQAVCTAMAGFGCGVGASGLTFLWVYRIYDQFENLEIFRAIKRYIRPIISGLLLTVAVSMLGENLDVGVAYGIDGWVMMLISAAILGMAMLMRRYRRCRLFTLIVFTAGASVLLCNGLCLLI